MYAESAKIAVNGFVFSLSKVNASLNLSVPLLSYRCILSYRCMHTERGGRGDGVGFYVRQSMVCGMIYFSITEHVEHLWISIEWDPAVRLACFTDYLEVMF